jgi:hypothetical protein
VEIRGNVELPPWFVKKTLDALGVQRQAVRRARQKEGNVFASDPRSSWGRR